MPTIGPHTFSIVSNGHTLHEYEPPADEDFRPSESYKAVYIEAVEGAMFEVKCESRGRLQFVTGHLGVFLWFDDDYVVSQLVSKSKYHKRTGQVLTFDKVIHFESGTWVERNFHFNNLTTTDTVPKSADLKKIAKGAGKIKIAIYDLTAPTEEYSAHAEELKIKTATPEKALKGRPIDMAAGYGAAKPATRADNICNSKRVGGPLFQCVFKYRSRKALQMLDLIPATPQPIALHERDPSTLSLAEARELLAQLQRQGLQMDTVKQEQTGVKREQDLSTSAERPRFNNPKRKASASIGEQDGSDGDDLIFVEAKKVKKSTPTSQLDVVDLS